MSGFQFAHIQNFSRKGDKGGRSVSFILAEARRDPGASLHVSSPQPPGIVWGCSIDDLEREHDDRVAVARKTIAGGKTRSVGREQHTLVTIVVSHPYTVEEIEADPAKRQEVERWEALNVAWARQELGDDLRSIIRHTDERHWHLHIYGLPGDPEMRGSLCHPGQVAKSSVVAAGPAEGEDDKAVRRRSDLAYKGAMRVWQDGYSKAVGVPSGLTRLGPGVRRLERAAWHQERVQAKALKDARDRAEVLKKQGDAFVIRTNDQAAAERAAAAQQQHAAQAAAERATKMQADADARAAAALAQQDLAVKRSEEARRATEQAKRATRSARRLSGVSGALRGIWDGLRKSSIAARIRQELAPTVDAWRAAASAADARAAAAEAARRDADETAKNLRAAAADLGAQRDGLRRRLAVYEPVTAPAPASAPRR